MPLRTRCCGHDGAGEEHHIPDRHEAAQEGDRQVHRHRQEGGREAVADLCQGAQGVLLKLRFRNHPKRKGEARKADKRLLTIAGRILRDLGRKLDAAGDLWVYAHKLELFGRVLAQKRKDKNKVYSLHEPSVSCIAKGKEHKPYEFGSKVSVATTRTRGIMVGALSFEGNPYDGNTLAPTLDQVEVLTGKRPKDAATDRGYRGRKEWATDVHPGFREGLPRRRIPA